MPFSLLMQSLFYDRPRLMHQVNQQLTTERELKDYINGLDSNDPFKSLATQRLNIFPTILSWLSQLNIQWVDHSHPYFPSMLHDLVDPPLGLFCCGDVSVLLDNHIGVVGTRRPSLTAESRLQSIIPDLKQFSTVSGGALGIDAMVHRLSLEYGVPTVAVLASGLDQMTPKTNQRLFQAIIESGTGCVISECPPGVSPKPYFFPQRNRLIAALSTKLIVVEAAKRSGAVLTANLAAGLGKDVGALVSGYNAPQSEGCYLLINDGAFVIGNQSLYHEFVGISSESDRIKVPDSTDEILSIIPTDPIHIEVLAQQSRIPISEMIDHVTRLALNGDVIISYGQMVYRC
jgi:DNA processing protein